MVFPNLPFPTLNSVLRWIISLRFHSSWQILYCSQIWEELKGACKIFSVNKCESKLWVWGSSVESPPVFSSAFALSCSDVFTINVRLLSVNTSIDTTQRFTAYASFRLPHLLNRRKRTEMRVSGITLAWPQQRRQTWRCSGYRNDFTFHIKKNAAKAIGAQTIAPFFIASRD